MKKYRVADAAAPYVQYDMIHLHTELPAYAEPRLQLLLGALSSSRISKDRAELFQLVTALVQLGMDTHDYVDTETGQRTEKQMRSRQMKILAGDYLSARFYQILAAAGEVELIGLLSKAVANVNRLKISFYENVKAATLTAEEYISSKTNLKSEMFLPFARYLEGPLAEIWHDLLQYVSRYEVIVEEIKDIATAGRYGKGFTYWSLLGEISSTEEKSMLKAGNYEHLLEKHNIRGCLLDSLHTAYESVIQLLEREQLQDLKKELLVLLEEMTMKVAKYSMKRVEAQ